MMRKLQKQKNKPKKILKTRRSLKNNTMPSSIKKRRLNKKLLSKKLRMKIKKEVK